MRYVIAYDVSDDTHRLKLANLLLDYGDRVQKSVFEAHLSPADLQEVLRRAANLIAPGDSLRAYPLCASCRGGTIVVGRPDRAPAELVMV